MKYFNLLNIFCRTQCWPQQCKECQTHFKDPNNKDLKYNNIFYFDCFEQCSKCKLCVGKLMKTIPECYNYCQDGVYGCAYQCNRGKEICLLCTHKCGFH